MDIVIVNYNTCSLMRACLESVKAHTDYPYRITVVDNGSTDGSRDFLRKLDWVTVVFNEVNRGYASACNQGAMAGSGAYILFLNSDTSVTPGWLSPMVWCAASDDRVAVVGNKLLDARGRLVGAGVVGSYDKPRIRGWGQPNTPGRYDRQEDVISVCGACFLIKRDLIPVLGLFDERYFFYYEDTDYCRNTRSRGYRVVYCPDSWIYHYVAQSPTNQRTRNSMLTRSRRLFREKWGEQRLASQKGTKRGVLNS